MVSKETVNSTKYHHSYSITYRISQKTLNSRSPVSDNVLCQFLVEIVGHERAYNRKPDNDEVKKVTDDIKYFVLGGETKPEGHLREEQEKEIMKITFEKERSQEDK